MATSPLLPQISAPIVALRLPPAIEVDTTRIVSPSRAGERRFKCKERERPEYFQAGDVRRTGTVMEVVLDYTE